jgi:HD-like signal output (HDOD) protein
MVANSLRLGLADEAFLAGLIHDIGLMVEMQADRNKLIEVLRRVGADAKGVPATDMLEAEQANFEATHQDFGAGLCEKWKFPAENRTLVSLVYVADRLAADTGMGFRQDLLNTNVDAEVLEFLKLSNDKLAEVRAQLIAQSKDLSNVLGM